MQQQLSFGGSGADHQAAKVAKVTPLPAEVALHFLGTRCVCGCSACIKPLQLAQQILHTLLVVIRALLDLLTVIIPACRERQKSVAKQRHHSPGGHTESDTLLLTRGTNSQHLFTNLGVRQEQSVQQ